MAQGMAQERDMFNDIVWAVATNNGTRGDMAYGSEYATKRNERAARRILQAVDMDYVMALTVARISL